MAFSEIFAAFRWWLALLVLGTAVLPLTLLIFQRLPDKGYALSKMAGLLLVSFFFWLLGSLGFVGNNLGGISLAVLIVIALSAWAWHHLKEANAPSSPLDQLRSPDFRRQILITELVFASIFILWVWVRSQNPAIAATEKPMEFAFLNSLGRTPTFPPVDPWLSGYAISYYYFGYVMTSVIARLAAVAEPVAFNLGIAWLVAGTAVGAMGIVSNLILVFHEKLKTLDAAARRQALILGLVAAVAIPIAGNLEIGLEMAHQNGIGSAQFWHWLDVRDLNGAPTAVETPRYQTSSWWWWRSSRVIHEYTLAGRAEEGLEPIAEFPGFSFVLGDMHPHVLALPFAFLSLAVALAWYLEDRPPARRFTTPLFLFTAVTLGGLSFLNTWDVLIHLFIIVGAFWINPRVAQNREGSGWWETAVLGFRLVFLSFLLYLPFYIGFRSQAGAPYLLPFFMRPTRLAHFLIIFGMPLTVLFLWIPALFFRQKGRQWQTGLRTALLLIIGLFLLALFLGWVIASSSDGAGRIAGLAADLGVTLPVRTAELSFGWGARAVAILLPAIISAKITYPWLTFVLSTLIALIVALWAQYLQERGGKIQTLTNHPNETDASTSLSSSFPRPVPFVLLLVLTGLLLTLGPEFVYLRDNFGQRLNTIFKFYYQTWMLFGVAALFGLNYLWCEFRRLRWPAVGFYAGALLVSLAFPFFAVQSRAAEFRGGADAENRLEPTLNGLAQVARFNQDEYDAMMWLRENVRGTPTILEAVGGQYSQYGRISASTGLPTVLGWAGHEYQWRGPGTQEPARREPLVTDIYGGADWASTADLLNRLDVSYIYVGGLELNTYGPRINEKFDGRLDPAYQNNSVTIYRWQPQN